MRSGSVRRSNSKKVKSMVARKATDSKVSRKVSTKETSHSSKEMPVSANEVSNKSVVQPEWKDGELDRYRRLDMVEALAGGIAHDINNALTAIMHNIYAAKMFLSNDARREEVPSLLDAGMKTIRRATALTHRLLTFSAEGRPFRRSLYLKNVIRDYSRFSLSGSNVMCEFHIDDDLWPAYVDERQVAQVISNLIINEKQTMPRGGTIDVTAENVNLGKDEVLNLKGGKYVRLSIKNRVVSIPKEHLSKVFDIKKEGSGPELATSYLLIRQNDGLITVDSEEGVGTTFHVYLPASETGIETRCENKSDFAGGNVLVMEGEEDIAHSMRFVLTLLGYESEFVRDGTGAIAAYESAWRTGMPFDVVILDLTVPGGMGGIETIKTLKDKYPDVRAVIASGYSNDPAMTDFKTHGFVAAIKRPYNVEDLDRLLRRLIPYKGSR